MIPARLVPFALIFCLGPALPLLGQTSAPTTRPGTIWVVPPKAQPKAPATSSTADEYAGEPLVVLESDNIYRYNADGSGAHTVRGSLRLQSEAAVRQWGVLTIPYAASNEAVHLTYLRVHKADGTVVTTDPGTAQDMPTEVTREAPLYSDQRQLQIPIQSLAVGDTLEYEAVIEMRKPEAPNEFWGAWNFEQTAVELNENVELHVPAASKVTVRSETVQPSQETVNGDRVYRWHTEQLEPSVRPDGSKPDEETPKLVPDIGWTTFPDWAAVGDWYRELAAGRAVPDAAIQARAAALVAGATTTDEKIARLYEFVSMRIHYIGIDFGMGRYQPHTAAEVLAAGYGDCKDKATLLTAMLATQGITASPVLIGANVHLDKNLPAPSFFNHLVNVIDEPGGKKLWLDSTAEITPPGMLIAVLRDEDALVIPANAKATLEHTPETVPFTAADTLKVQGALDGTDTFKGHFDVVLHGDLETYFRAGLFSTNRAQWPTVSQAIVAALGYGGKASNFTAENVEDPSKPLHLAWDYERDNFGDWANLRIVPMTPGAFFGFATLDKQPVQPIVLGAPRVETATSVMTLPPGYAPKNLPADLHLKSRFATLDIENSLNGQVLTTSEHLQVLQATLPEKDWEEFNDFSKQIDDHTGVFMELAKTDATPGQPAVAAQAPADNMDFANAEMAAKAYEALRTNNMAAVNDALAAVRNAGAGGAGEWLWSAVIADLKHDYAGASTDLEKEQAAHLDEYNVLLPFRLTFDLQQRGDATRMQDAVDTLSALRKLHPDDADLTRQEAVLLLELKRSVDAVVLMEEALLQNPADKANYLALGAAQNAADRPREAEVTLKALLAGTDDPGMLNNGAYELVNHGVDLGDDLPAAATAAKRALRALATQTQTISPQAVTRAELAVQALLVNTWDTLGWIEYLSGNPQGAEPLIRDAWVADGNQEVGYHLGMVEEKLSRPNDALAQYMLADAAGKNPAQHDKIAARIAALQAAGAKAKLEKTPDALRTQLRSMSLPMAGNSAARADFWVLADAGGVRDVEFLGGDASLHGEDAVLLKALQEDRSILPQPADQREDANAKLLRRGTLDCSPSANACRFLLLRPQETRLDAGLTVTAPNAPAQAP